ncbi:hypothetical protein BKA83DRAFT_4203116 [Pisolithus microcarpus]|nr:hypothetical protein BKA83DRAFT_4203116 [Pisolithus microcarpus]
MVGIVDTTRQVHIPSASAMPANAVPQQNPQSFDPTAPFLPQHFMQEFLRLSTPNGKTYKQALEALHGINNHAANLWKDYYLDHHDRIEMLFQLPRSGSGTSSSQATQKRTLSPTLVSNRSSPKLRGRLPKQSQSKRFSRTPPGQTTTTIRPPKRPRATMNSLSADPAPTANTMVRGLTPPHADIPVPDPPSRSPTPPTIIHVGTNGNRYTPEDRDYFIKFITWKLKQNPWLTKRQLCDQLAVKVPHHSSTSWASHWHSREDAESRADSEPKSLPHTSERNSPDQDADTEDDEADMGEPGTPFTRGDWCMMARFMARSDWDEMTPKEKFDTFAETHDTERSAKSWAEFYRKNQDALLKLAKRYSKHQEDSEDIYNRRARPSWAQRYAASDRSPSDEDGDYEIDEGDN